VFGLRLALEDNPATRDPWVAEPGAGVFTPAHWALGEGRFAHLFQPLGEDAPDPLPLADYLGLPARERRGRTPYVEQATNGEQARRLRVDDRLVRVCAQRQQAWRMLQELAGLVTPFTERVRGLAEQQVAAQHAAQLAQQAQAYEQRIEGLQAEMQTRNRQALRERLMRLAGYRRPDNPQPEPDR
jgi:pyruvate-ferredoxin/flavodoxin oxidoreductase